MISKIQITNRNKKIIKNEYKKKDYDLLNLCSV